MEPSRLLCPSDFPGNNNGVGCCFLLQGIFLTQGSNPCLLRLLCCRWYSLLQSHQGSPSHVATDYHVGQHRYRMFSSSQKVLLGNSVLEHLFEAVLKQPSLEMWVKAFLVWGLQNSSFALLTVFLCTKPMENAWLMPAQVSTLMPLSTDKCHINTG